MELLAYLSQSQNPWFNQAVEEVLHEGIKKNQVILLIWQNRQSINIGRDQNPWFICNTRYAHQNRVSIIRRQTPGGAIYHDPGHTNFSLIGNEEQLDLGNLETILKKAIALLKIDADIDQQKELVADNRKISNTAYISINGNTLIHSAIRVNTNLSAIDEYMTCASHKPQSKIIDNYSNLCEQNPTITHADLQQRLVEAFGACYSSKAKIQKININPLPAIEGLGEKLHFISSWGWNYGQSPNFSRQIERQFSWGKVNLSLQITKGTITEIQFHSSQRFHSLFNTFSTKMIGYPYQAKSVMPVICTMLIDFSANHAELLEFASWLEKELS